MKAVLVIDAPDELIGEVDYTVLNKNKMENGRALLRPLPQERKHIDISEIIWDDDLYALGFNRCLHEITGTPSEIDISIDDWLKRTGETK